MSGSGRFRSSVPVFAQKLVEQFPESAHRIGFILTASQDRILPTQCGRLVAPLNPVAKLGEEWISLARAEPFGGVVVASKEGGELRDGCGSKIHSEAAAHLIQ